MAAIDADNVNALSKLRRFMWRAPFFEFLEMTAVGGVGVEAA
jgi:hypothetical protein